MLWVSIIEATKTEVMMKAFAALKMKKDFHVLKQVFETCPKALVQ